MTEFRKLRKLHIFCYSVAKKQTKNHSFLAKTDQLLVSPTHNSTMSNRRMQLSGNCCLWHL